MINSIEEVLIGMASDSSQHVREAALAAMDRVRAKRLVDRFRELLKKGTMEERVHVIHVAVEMADGEGIALLLEALYDQPEIIRGAAVRALLPFPTPVVLKVLWEILPKEKGFVLSNIIEVFGSSGRKELRPHIERYLRHPEAEVRAKAIIAVSRLADGTGLEKILAMREDKDEMIRAAVAEGLGNWTSSQP